MGLAEVASVDRREGKLDSARGQRPQGICVVGSGPHFLSGISYYTNKLVNELGRHHRVSAILMRELLPKRFYPGRERVGASLTHFTYPPGSKVFDGVNWWWGRSIVRALALLRSERPDVIVFQWWSGTVLHTYLALAALGRLRGARMILEFHEVLDTAETEIALARWYVRALLPLLLRMCDGYVVHSEFDREALEKTYSLGDTPITMIPHGPYDQYKEDYVDDRNRASEEGPCQLLYFGVIRPFKGVEDLIAAFNSLSDEEVKGFRLKVVGETWEGCTRPREMIARSPHRDRIEFINHYVKDDEVACLLSSADAIVLPYHRSSSSGPLHLAMASGLPVVVTAVGGLVEATMGYEGAIQIPPKDPDSIREALRRVRTMRGRHFTDVHSWDRTLRGFDGMFDRVLERGKVGVT